MKLTFVAFSGKRSHKKSSECPNHPLDSLQTRDPILKRKELLVAKQNCTTYCTVVAQNYLPQALALYKSVRLHAPNIQLTILVIDGERQELELGRPNLRVVGINYLGLDEREVLNLAAIYDVVEFSTSIKPLFFLRLLDEYERVGLLKV
jgi:hypothetical protein